MTKPTTNTKLVVLPSHKWGCQIHGSGFGNLMTFQCPVCGMDLRCLPHADENCEECR